LPISLLAQFRKYLTQTPYMLQLMQAIPSGQYLPSNRRPAQPIMTAYKPN